MRNIQNLALEVRNQALEEEVNALKEQINGREEHVRTLDCGSADSSSQFTEHLMDMKPSR
jgi:hypothetical protein